MALFPNYQNAKNVRQDRWARALVRGCFRRGPYSAANTYTRWFFESTVMVRAPRSVVTVPKVSYLPPTCFTIAQRSAIGSKRAAERCIEFRTTGVCAIAGVAIT